MRDDHRKRSKSDRNRGDLKTVACWLGERQVFSVVFRSDGPHIHFTCDPSKLTGAEKEEAADWLKEHLPRLSHDQRFALLFGSSS